MSLLTPFPSVPESRVDLGIGNTIDVKQIIPGASDYVIGGYPLPATQFNLTHIHSADIVAQNAAAASYTAALLFPATYFPAAGGVTAGLVAPATQINFQVTQPASTGAGLPLTLGAPVTATNSALTSNVVTITAPNSYVAGQYVIIQGMTNVTAANGLMVQIVTASATNFTFNITSANVGTAADTGTATLVTSATGPITAPTPIISSNSALTSNVATITIANTFKPGQFVTLQGFSNALATAFNGYTVQVISATSTSFTFNFTHANITSGADTGTAALLVTPGLAPVTLGTPAVITNSALTSNVASLTAAQAFVPGTLVSIQGLTNGATLNGQILTVISTSLTNALFKANLTLTNITTGADAGVAVPLVGGVATGGSSSVEVPFGTNLSGCAWAVRVVGY